jgi:hypothetical protein
MDLHMCQIKVRSSFKRALTYTSYLSHEAYDRLYKLKLPEAVWTDGDALRRQLRLVFGECKTLESYRTEMRAAKQLPEEVAAEFFDRLYGLTLSAFPGQDPNTNEVMQDLFASQFIGGLRLAALRTAILRVPYASLAELREAAVEHEAAEAIGSGQPARLTEKGGGKQKQQGKSNAAASQPDQAQANIAESTDQSKDGKKRSKSKKKKGQKDKTGSDQQQNSNNQSDTKPKVTCGYCGKTGHSVDNCWTKDQSLRPSGSQQTGVKCFRCGRMNHAAIRCWAEKHADGHALQPNGVTRPERSNADSNAAQASNAAAASSTVGTSASMTFLNSGWDGSYSRAARPGLGMAGQ